MMKQIGVLLCAFLVCGGSRPDAGWAAEPLWSTRVAAQEAGQPAVDEPAGDAAAELVSHLQVNLYATLEFQNLQGMNSEFDARNVELLLGAKMGSRLKGFAELEFERVATTEPSPREGAIEVEQGWMEFAILDQLAIRGGVILVPFGRFNLEHFDTTRELTSRPVMARFIVPGTWAEPGVGMVAHVEYGETVVSYQGYVVNGLRNDAVIDDTNGLHDDGGAFGEDNNNNKAVVGRLMVSPRYGQEFGISGYYGAYAPSRAVQGVDADLKLTFGAIELLAEYAYLGLDSGLNDGGVAVPTKLHGAYAQVAYQFWFDALSRSFLGRGFNDPKFTLVGQWGYASISDDGDVTGGGDNRTTRYVVGMNYRPAPTFVIKVEYLWNTQTNEAIDLGGSNGVMASMSAAF
ncbi:MAG: hypothetical protein HY208_03470 [Nitrospirae bacterium]|nr:hypothetical protein [Nitrospirota bacterium]